MKLFEREDVVREVADALDSLGELDIVNDDADPVDVAAAVTELAREVVRRLEAEGLLKERG